MHIFKVKFLLFIILTHTSTTVIAQSSTKPSAPIEQRSKANQTLSPTAQLLINPELRDPFIAKFQGKFHAQAIVNELFISENNEFIVTRIQDPEIAEYSIVHLKFDENNINQIIHHPGLVYLEVSSKLNSPKPLNDTARIHSRVDKAENGLNNGLSQNYTGKGVVVGIVDIGFQTDHPTFYSPDGKNYRVQRFWNQQKQGNPPSLFNYGTEYLDSTNIASAIDDDGAHEIGRAHV